MLLALWKVIDTYDCRIEVGGFPLPGGGGEPGVPFPPDHLLLPSLGWVWLTAQGTLYWFVLRTFQNFYFYWLSHFCWLYLLPFWLGQSARWALRQISASQNNWWKVTLPLQPTVDSAPALPWSAPLPRLGARELIDSSLLLKGVFFLRSLHYSLFIFPLHVSFLVAWWVAQLMHGSACPGMKQGEGEQGQSGNGIPHQQWPALGLTHLPWWTLLVIIWPY